MSDPRIVTKAKGRVHIPAEVSIEDGLDLFNQGYGKALGAALTYIEKNNPEQRDQFKQDLLLKREYYINRIHIKQPVT